MKSVGENVDSNSKFVPDYYHLCETSAERLFIRDMLSHPILTKEEERELAIRNRQGDEEAREKLFNSNLRRVFGIALRHYKKRNLSHMKLLDLVQEGSLGLLSAIEKYDPDIAAFSTYATPYIDGSIKSSLYDKEDEIRKPVDAAGDLSAYLRMVAKYDEANIPLPDKSVQCEILGFSPKKLETIEQASRLRTVSLNAHIDASDDDSVELDHYFAKSEDHSDEVLNEVYLQEVGSVLKEEVLTPAEYYIFYFIYMVQAPKKPKEIAEIVYLTRQRVEQIAKRAVNKAKPYLARDSGVYARTWQRIVAREGTKVSSLNYLPIMPNDIVDFLYMKQFLTKLQQDILRDKLLGKYIFSCDRAAIKYGISSKKVEDILVEIEQIMAKVLNDECYLEMRNRILNEKKSEIFSLNVEGDIYNYDELARTYFDMSFEDIKQLCGSNFNKIPAKSRNLLKNFLYRSDPETFSASTEMLINLTLFNYRKKDTRLKLRVLYESYLEHKDKFSFEHRLYLECFFFKTRNKSDAIKRGIRHNTYKMFDLVFRLERYHFGIDEIFYFGLNKTQYMKVRDKHGAIIPSDKLDLLDKFFGVGEDEMSYEELAVFYGVRKEAIKSKVISAREFCQNLYANRSQKKQIDASLYIPFVENPIYEFTDETRKALALNLIGGKSNNEIANILGLSCKKVAGMIIEGLKRIDFFRFGIIAPFALPESELGEFYHYYEGSFSRVDEEIIYFNHYTTMTLDEAIQKINSNPEMREEDKIDKNYCRKIIKRFQTNYKEYLCRDVTVTLEDLSEEISRPLISSVTSEREKKALSLYCGFKNAYNPTGEKMSSSKVGSRMGLSTNVVEHIVRTVKKHVKYKKAGLLKPELLFIEVDELDSILDDAHLPIGEDDRYIICSLFGLKGYSQKTVDELESEFDGTEIRRKYYTAIVNIRKYQRGEIAGRINFEKDIAPIMRYFSKSDRLFIYEYYKNGLSYAKLAKKYGLSEDKVIGIFDRIKIAIFEILNDEKTLKFDFMFYEQNIDNPTVPFYGDVKVAKAAFDLLFGETRLERLSLQDVVKELKLSITATNLSKVIYNYMVSFCKLGIGIEKENAFTNAEVVAYYETHKDEMSVYQRGLYEKFFRRAGRDQVRTTSTSAQIPQAIVYDLMKERIPNLVSLNSMSRKTAMNLLKEYGRKLPKSCRDTLMMRFGISSRDFISGKDKIKVYRILNQVDGIIKQNQVETQNRESNDFESGKVISFMNTSITQ